MKNTWSTGVSKNRAILKASKVEGTNLPFSMEWINEGAALIFLSILVLVITLADPAQAISRLVYICVFGFLNVLSLISIFTGFRVNFLPFKLCPFIFTGSSILILLGGII